MRRNVVGDASESSLTEVSPDKIYASDEEIESLPNSEAEHEASTNSASSTTRCNVLSEKGATIVQLVADLEAERVGPICFALGVPRHLSQFCADSCIRMFFRHYGSIDVRQCQFICGMALLAEACEVLFERRGASSMSMDRE